MIKGGRDWNYVTVACEERLARVDPNNNLVRLFHGRGKTHSGFNDVTVDLFGRVIVVALFAKEDTTVVQLAEQLRHLTGHNGRIDLELDGVLVQHRRGRETRSEVLWGEVPTEVVAREAGLSYMLRPRANQNVGLFLDAAPLRRWVSAHAQDRNVLNLFAYTCGFSVAAIAGGATQVVNNDMSRSALDWGRANHDLNDKQARGVRYIAHNLLKSWAKLRKFGPYGLIVIDPPTRQAGSFDVEKQYGTILKRMAELAAPQAHIAACLNSPFLGQHFLENQVARWCPQAKLVGWLEPSADFPDSEPQRALKVGLYKMRS